MTHGTRPRGFIALFSVVVVGALVLVLGLSVAFMGQTDVIISGHVDRGASTRDLVQACIDEALYRLRLDPTYTGGAVPIGSDSCTVAVSGSGTTRTVTASATSDVYTKSITVSALQKTNTAGNAKGWGIESWTENDPP